MSLTLCVVMPAYNEEECIEPVVKKWLTLFDAEDRTSGALVVVNDGSKDGTGRVLDKLAQSEKRLKVFHQQNGGHGNALLNAYRQGLALDPQWIFHVDSDDQFEPADFPKLWSRREESNFILGYRANRQDALHRLVITRILRLLNLLMFGCYLRDANVPYRLIRASYLRKMLELIPETVFAPNIFLSVLARRAGEDLMEIPIQHQDRRTGTVSIVRMRLIKACLRCVRELFDFRLRLGTTIAALKNFAQSEGIA